MISYWPLRSASMISGMQVIGCWLNASPSTFLWLKSPIDLVRFSPLTLPWMMGTPVLEILYLSMGFYGLWSNERGIHFSACHSAALESPAFAQITLSGVTATTTAVAPAFKSDSNAVRPSYSLLYFISQPIPGFIFINSYTWINVSVSACPIFPSTNDFLFENTSTKWAATNLETSPPPCPSKTPKSAIWVKPGTYSQAMQASSMFFLQPCIQHTAYLYFWLYSHLPCFSTMGLSRQALPISNQLIINT